MTKKLTNFQKQTLKKLLDKKISEAESEIRRQEKEKLDEIENNPPKDIAKIFNEYKKLFYEEQKIRERMNELEKKMERKEWYISSYNLKPVLVIGSENPIMRKLLATTKEKIDRLAKLREKLELEVAFITDSQDIDEYLKTIENRIENTIN
jgi:hypothetical protein